nr:RNA-directed DNA polymerase, eukaryota [Tanacetum cinerariifolium]
MRREVARGAVRAAIYPRLFALENNKVCTVAAKMSAPFVTSLRRDVRGGEESAQLSRISDLLDTVVLSNMGDRRFWDLNGDECFRVKDVRRMLDDMLLSKSDVPSRWVKQIPIMVNVLAWKISMDRLPTRVNLHRRGVQVSPISCPICCEALENLDHLLFRCDLAKDIARSICNWWGLVWNPVDNRSYTSRKSVAPVRNRILVYPDSDEEDEEYCTQPPLLPCFQTPQPCATFNFVYHNSHNELDIDNMTLEEYARYELAIIAKEKEEVQVEDIEMDENHDIDHSTTKEALQWSLEKDPFLFLMEPQDQSNFMQQITPSSISNDLQLVGFSTTTGVSIKPKSSPTLLLTFSSIIFRSVIQPRSTYTLIMLSYVMSTPAHFDSEIISQTDRAQSSRVPTPLPNDPYMAVRHAHLVDTDTESGPLEVLREAEIPQPLLVVPSPIPSSDDFHLTVGQAYKHAIVDTESEPEEAPSEIREGRGPGSEEDGPSSEEEEEEAAPEGQQQTILVVATAADGPLGLGYETPPSPEWSPSSLQVSPSSLVVPTPVASPVTTPAATIAIDKDEFLEVRAPLKLHESILHDHTHRLDVLPLALFEGYDKDLRELYTRSMEVRDEIFSQCYRLRSLEWEQESATVTFDKNPIRTLGDYSKPSHEGYRNIIELPIANNVVPLRSDTIWLVQNGCPFYGLCGPHDTQHFMENPKQAFADYASSRTDEAGGEAPAKMEDPGLFTLHCRLWDSKPFDTLANLGSCINIISLYLFKKLNIGLLEETDYIFRLADETKSYLVRIVKDVEVHIGKLKLLNDFYVINMKKDPETPLLVGKGFLATANAVIDCRMAKIAVGEGIIRSVFGVK